MSDKKFYVYLHRYASGPKEGQVFYVGKGQGKRLTETHCRKNNRHWVNTAKKYGVQYEILLRFNLEVCAFSFERALIKHYGRDALCNLTDGGEGSSGYRHTESTKVKMSLSKTGEKNGNYKKIFSASHRQKISEKMKERMSSLKAKEAVSLASSKPVKTECGLKFKSQTEAVNWLIALGWIKARQCAISACCTGRVNTAYGYRWEFC